MAAKKKLEKQELKAPDQFVSFWSKVGSVIAARRQLVLGGLVGLLALGVVTWGVQSFMRGHAERSSRDFARITRIATAALIPETGPAPKSDDDVPHFKTDKERLEAALAETDNFLRTHDGSGLRAEASLLRARFLVSLGRPAEAVPLYTTLVTSVDRRLRFLAEEGLAYAQEGSGQIDQAIATFGSLADHGKESGNFFRDRALFNKARLLEKKGNAQEAQKVYRDILSEVPQSALKDEINDRLAVLEGK